MITYTSHEIDDVIGAVKAELIRACSRFAPYASPHEGIAVIHEEYLELREHVYGNSGRSAAAIVEAIQLAAVAARYALEVGP